jgi:hypothetical protein
LIQVLLKSRERLADLFELSQIGYGVNDGVSVRRENPYNDSRLVSVGH